MQEEPHASRKTEILKKHPEIKELMRPEPLTKWVVFGTVALQVCSPTDVTPRLRGARAVALLRVKHVSRQLMTGRAGQVLMAAVTLEWSWLSYLTAIYVVGATANHSLFLAIHELSHNLGFKSVSNNKLLSMVANLPIGIPYCITFKPYHMEHHRYQVVFVYCTYKVAQFRLRGVEIGLQLHLEDNDVLTHLCYSGRGGNRHGYPHLHRGMADHQHLHVILGSYAQEGSLHVLPDLCLCVPSHDGQA